MQTILVKIGKFPGTTQELALEPGTTVQQAAEIANLGDTSGFSVSVGSDPADLNTVLEDGDIVLFTKKIKGN